jgi:lipopolysaccharide export system permease protein
VSAHRLVLPVLGRYLCREFARTFVLTLVAFLCIYVVADFFDRFDTYIRNDVTVAAIVRSVVYRLPLVVTQVLPVAVLAGGLIGLGLLARSNEFVALRACGVSLWQILTPLLAFALVLVVAVFIWNETVVPEAAQRWHYNWNREIRKRRAATLFTGREVWYRGRGGFYNIHRVAARRRTLYGITIYQLGDDFRPTRVIEAPAANWTGAEWTLVKPRTRTFGPGGVHDTEGAPADFRIPESLEDFQVVSVEGEELSYGALRSHIRSLQSKGLDVSDTWVDLYLKGALPAGAFIMMLIAVPLAARGTRTTSLPRAVGFGFVIGFGYIIVLAFARALGQNGALPPLVAAWSSNVLFTLVGLFFVLEGD